MVLVWRECTYKRASLLPDPRHPFITGGDRSRLFHFVVQERRLKALKIENPKHFAGDVHDCFKRSPFLVVEDEDSDRPLGCRGRASWLVDPKVSPENSVARGQLFAEMSSGCLDGPTLFSCRERCRRRSGVLPSLWT